MSQSAAPDVLGQVEQVYRSYFGNEPLRASVSFLGVDPIEVLRFVDGLGQVYVSLGMARYPMSASQSPVVDALIDPRAELILAAADAPDGVWRQLAMLAAAPAVQGTVYRDGDRVYLEHPLCPGSRCVGAIVATSGLPDVELTDLAPVQILQVLPATSDELAWARVHGSEALQRRWLQAGTPLRDLSRGSVELS